VLGVLLAYFAPSFFSPATLGPVTPHLITLALIMILFHGGMEMDLAKAFGQSGRATVLAVTYLATVLAVTYFLLVTAGVTLAARFLLDFDWTSSLLFGPMIAGTSSVVIIPLSRKVGLREDTSLTIALESTITDVLNVVVFFALIAVYYGRSDGLLDTFRTSPLGSASASSSGSSSASRGSPSSTESAATSTHTSRRSRSRSSSNSVPKHSVAAASCPS